MKKNNITRENHFMNSEAVKKERKKLPGWFIFPILGVLVLVFFVFSKLMGGGEAKSTEMDVAVVEREDIKSVYNTSGTVESGKTKVFYSPVNAPVKICNAKVGTAVKAGDILVTFDTTNLERDNQRSELDVLSAKYSNQDALEQNSRTAQSAAQAEAQTAASIQKLRSQISEKQTEISQLQAQAESESAEAAKIASQTADLQQKIEANLNEQSAQKAVKENAERELTTLDPSNPEAAARIAELQTTAADATNRISQLEQEYRSLEQQLGQLGSADAAVVIQQLTAAQQELASLQQSLSELESTSGNTVPSGLTGAQLKNMQITENLAELAKLSTTELLEKGKEGLKAEFDGVIADVKAVEGSDTAQGMELFTLVSNQDVYIALEVPAGDFENLSIGSSATIKIGKHSYQGTVDSIDKIALPNAKGNPVVGAKVRLSNPDEHICIGVNAKVSITVAEKKKVLCLPTEVVNTSTDGDFVYVIRKGIVEKQAVETGTASSSKIEIVNGLEEGDQVISNTSGDVKEGMAAKAKEQ